MKSLPRLGRIDREIVSELRNRLAQLTSGVPEAELPNALTRFTDWREEKLYREAFGGSHAF